MDCFNKQCNFGRIETFIVLMFFTHKFCHQSTGHWLHFNSMQMKSLLCQSDISMYVASQYVPKLCGVFYK